MPEISIIVPVYNVERYLKSCIESILSQSYGDFELLLIDDGSTDKSGEICDEYKELDSRVHVYHKENGGVCSARNIGLDNATGNFYLLCDSDDIIHTNLLSICLKIIKEEKLDCLVYGYKTFSGEIYESHKSDSDVKEVLTMNNVLALKTVMEGKIFRMLACNKFYSASLWENIRFPENRKYGDDTSVTYLLLDKCKKLGYIKNPLYFYRMHEDSALHQKVSLINFQLLDAYDELIQYIKNNHNMLLEDAYYAYSVRLFDFFPKIINDFTLIKEIRKYIIKHFIKLFLNKRITYKQKIMLFVLCLSPSGFTVLYELKF